MFQNDVAYPPPSIETVCSDGAWLGMSQDKEYDLFRLWNTVFKVSRINGKVIEIEDDEAEALLN